MIRPTRCDGSGAPTTSQYIMSGRAGGMIVSPPPREVGCGSTSEALSSELEARGVGHAVVRHSSAEIKILLAPGDFAAFADVASILGLSPVSSRNGPPTWVAAGAEGREDARVVAVTELVYGRLRTGESEARILHRARLRDGKRMAAPQDELVELLLHCIVERGAFSVEDRARVSKLMSGLREDPVAAGRAAERVQQELAPALTWDRVLADVVHARWDSLLSRRGALRLRALAGSRPRWRRRRRATQAPLVTLVRGIPREPKPSGNGHMQRPSAEALSRKQIRGAGLLLTGRGLAIGFKLVAELLVVRYLATAEYGSWTYALSAVVLLKGVAALGLHRAAARFIPMHVERGEGEEFVGVLSFVLGALVLSGLAIALAFHAFPGAVAHLAGATPDQPLDILFILVFLVPVETIDDMLTNVCAAFGNSRTIFVRRYLLSPGLRLAVAALMVALRVDVRMLAYGYLLSGLAGVVYYAWSVHQEASRRGLLEPRPKLALRLPVRRVLSYTVPVMGADICCVLILTTSPLMLGYFTDMSGVALYQVVVPLVALNNVVAQAFGVLFEPAAARLQARDDRRGLDDLYWRSAAWVAVLGFPVFAIPFAAAEPLTVFLFGERYADAAPILSILTLGMFVDSSLRFNNAALRILGKVRWLLGLSALGAALNVSLNLLLIPRLGAVGAAVATSSALLASAVMKQVAMHLVAGVRGFDASYGRVGAIIALTTACLLVLRVTRPYDPILLFSAAAGGALLVLHRARSALSVADTFPELARVPLLGRLLG